MVKQKKKRTKVYTGADARVVKPSVTRVQAVERTAVGQWWFEKKRIVKPVGIATGVGIIVIWLIAELVRIVL